MRIQHKPYTYYGWGEIDQDDLREHVFPYTYFYRDNIDKYSNIGAYDKTWFCWDDFRGGTEWKSFFVIVNPYDEVFCACGINAFNSDGRAFHMKDLQHMYNNFIESTFFDTTKLPKPTLHTSTLLFDYDF